MANELRIPSPAPCEPPRWVLQAHLQTILGAYWPAAGPRFDAQGPEEERARVALADGDELLLHVLPGSSDSAVLLFHGLGGSASSLYVRDAAAHLGARGHAIVAVNQRGAGAGRGLAAGPFHAGRTSDLAAAVAFARERFPGKRLFAVGFSLSGNTLLLQLGRREGALPDGAVAVNPPVDLAACSRALARGLNRVYDLHFALLARRALAQRARDGLMEVEPRPPLLGGLRAVDERWVAPAGGFRDADDYRACSSAAAVMGDIETPTVVLHARDDPFVETDSLRAACTSPAVHLHLEARGGHLGYLTRAGGRARLRRWLGPAVDHFVEALRSRAR